MSSDYRFSFERARGLVWVCDIANSAKLLNDDATASELEEFIPRFHWMARQLISSMDGEFIKWTGDGFLAWFPTPLLRDFGKRSALVLDMLWHASVIVNKTKLNVNLKKPIKIRHGISIEHDAVITTIKDGNDSTSHDLIGRSVILAFRMSGINAHFPNIIAQKEVIDAAKEAGLKNYHFKKLNLKSDDILKHFKGEKWGTSNLVFSSQPPPRGRNLDAIIKSSKKVIKNAQSKPPEESQDLVVLKAFIKRMSKGPDWASETITEYSRYVKEDLLGTLVKTTEILEEVNQKIKESGLVVGKD